MPARNLEKRFGMIALKKGFITEGQLNSALDRQMRDTIQQRRHRVLGTILFDQGHITFEQIDQVLGAMKESISSKHL